jgi:hypothetical protein
MYSTLGSMTAEMRWNEWANKDEGSKRVRVEGDSPCKLFGDSEN